MNLEFFLLCAIALIGFSVIAFVTNKLVDFLFGDKEQK